GSLVDRGGFLAQTARPVTISNLMAHDVEIRMFGNIAIIHARTSYTMADGRPGAGRYTDVWARQHGEWLPASAHVTRCRCREARTGDGGMVNHSSNASN